MGPILLGGNMKEDLSKYIGLIHRYQGKGQYCDCLNLVTRFYHDHHYKQDFDDHKERPKTYEEYIKTQPTRMVRYLIKNFKVTENINELEYGDVVLTLINGDPHIGVYIDDDKVLAMEVPVIEGKSKSTIYKGRYWKPFFRAGFKRSV